MPMSLVVICSAVAKYLMKMELTSQKVSDTLDTLRNQGKASILVAADGLCVGVIGLSDMRSKRKRWSLS